MPIFRTKDENFFKRWSSEMAYVLGFFAADGHMNKNKRGAHFVSFYSNDRIILERIRTIVGSNHKVGRKEYHNKNWNTSYSLQIGSGEWFKDLTNLGFMQRKSKRICLPPVPDTYLKHFVRGYFDGDGCVHLGRYWYKDRGAWKWQLTSRFTSGNRMFLSDLLRSLKPHIPDGFIYQKKRGYDLVFAQHASVALFQFMYHNVPAGAYLERKHHIFQKAFTTMQLRA